MVPVKKVPIDYCYNSYDDEYCYQRYAVAEWYGTVPDLRSRGRGFESRPWLLCANANSAFRVS